MVGIRRLGFSLGPALHFNAESGDEKPAKADEGAIPPAAGRADVREFAGGCKRISDGR